MRQYFAYGIFSAAFLTVLLRPDAYSLSLTVIGTVVLIVFLYFSEAGFRTKLWESIGKDEKKLEEVEQFFSKRMEEILRRLETIESQKEQVTKDLAETKRVVRDINLSNTFVPRAKRNSEI